MKLSMQIRFDYFFVFNHYRPFQYRILCYCVHAKGLTCSASFHDPKRYYRYKRTLLGMLAKALNKEIRHVSFLLLSALICVDLSCLFN